MSRAAYFGLFFWACAPTPEPAPPPTRAVPTPPATKVTASSPPALVPEAIATPTQLEPDGNDELTADALVPTRGHFEKVGRHWAALSRVCDFAVHGDRLFMAHATQPLGLGGASLTRYDPDAKPPLSLGFDWNRPGEPEKGGGAGQGFLRLRAIDQRLYAPDADPPYLGLGRGAPIEGYVFVSDAEGAFAAARMPGHLPPRSAVILPGAVHGFDVIRFRGKLYASTSAMIPPNGSASSSPGTLLTPSEDPSKPWHVAFTYAGAPGEASVRLGYMTRFRDRLYVAISPLYGADTHDFVVLSPPRDRATITQEDARAVQITPHGGAHTLRFYADRGKLYWIAIGRDGAALRESDDGERFRVVPLPREAGAPSDVLRVGERVLVLTEQGLYERDGERFTLRAAAPTGKPAFQVDDAYCAAPLVAFRGHVYVGDQQRGNLWKLVSDG